tara:strand:+ start:12148 stop:13389 length:1242 start_codon:yes stop_codon:yes gene_type:complete
MKKILGFALMVVLLLAPVQQAFAASPDELDKKIAALEAYIERNYRSHEDTRLSVEELREIISEGAQWMNRAQEGNGHFAYEYDVYEGQYLDDDHIVRQGGALYQLGEIARYDTDNALGTHEVIESAIEYFEDLSVADTEDGEKILCITEDTDRTPCLLGATALAVTGMLGYVEAVPEKADEYDELIDDYMAYIMAMKKEGEGFRDKYRTGSSLVFLKESSFSNGEALLALVRYYKHKPSEEVKEMIDETFAYLAAKAEFENPLYLWIMAALKDMQQLWPSEEYVAYAQAFTEYRRAQLSRIHYTQKNYCASTEGLASAYSVLQGNVTDYELGRVRDEIDFWNKHNSVLQVTEVDAYRLIDDEQGMRLVQAPDVKNAQGGFLTSATVLTQRIDYTQHCLSAYLQTLVDVEGEVL